MSYFYVNMKCKIDLKKNLFLPENLEFLDINSIDKETLYQIFESCFEKGDAQFYKNLRANEKRGFFESELGFPKVLKQPESHIIKFKDEIIGYTLAMQYGKANVQISCMCVLPKFQGNGYGEAMLINVEQVARKREMKTLSLGTEDTMKAYKLYSKYGFKVTKTYEIK